MKEKIKINGIHVKSKMSDLSHGVETALFISTSSSHQTYRKRSGR
jgi:hypothetical protein